MVDPDGDTAAAMPHGKRSGVVVVRTHAVARPLRFLLVGLAAVLLASRAGAATISVTTTDNTSAVACTLRDAITAANTDAASGACPAGAGDDVVDLTGLSGEIVTGGLGLPDLTTNMHVRGPGATLLTIDGADANRGFTVSGGTVVISDLRIFRGVPPEMFGAGGGVRCINATLTLTRVVVMSSIAFFGGGVFVGNCTATIEDSTIFLNSTTGSRGGGISTGALSTLALVNTTVSGNFTTGTNVAGGGLAQSTGVVTITNCTFSNNTATSLEGWSIVNAEQPPPDEPDDPPTGTLRLANTIIANSSSHNCLGPIVSDGHNLSDDNTCGLTAFSDRPGTPAGLAAFLSDNGGPTLTLRLMPGSTALDLGAACPPADQRGVQRPVDGNADGAADCDAGAFELGCEDALPSGTACAPATNPCVDDVCDALTLTCQHASNTAPCDDGNACTLGDLCADGVCAGAAVPCPVAGTPTFGECITGETETGPTGTNACAQIEHAASFGLDSGLDNLRSIVETADGRSVYVASGGDDAVARFDRDPATGILTYQGCFTGELATDSDTNTCAEAGETTPDGTNSGLDLLQSVAVSADGTSLYAASPGDDAVVRFDRDPATGALTYQGCLTGELETGTTNCIGIGTATASGTRSGLDEVRAVAVSDDGTSAYAVSPFDDAVARFDRDLATGALVYRGCITGDSDLGPDGTNTCIAIPGAVTLGRNTGLDGLFALALSADGRSLYTVSFQDDAVARFDRDPATGALTYQGCITGETPSNDTQCVKIPGATAVGEDSGLNELYALALSPDGKSLYTASQGDDAVARFDRDTATGALTYRGCVTGEIASGPSPPLPGSGACVPIPSATPNGSDSGLDKPRSVGVSADGKSVYASSPADDSVVHFLRDVTDGALTYDGCLTGEIATGPTGTNACAAIAGATTGGNDSGIDNPQAFAVSADGRTLYTASGNDAAVARFTLAPEPEPPPTTSTTLPALARPIGGKSLLIVDTAPSKRKIVFVSKDAGLDTSAGSGIDPVADGAVLQVFNAAGTGDTACIDLPAAGWTAKGNAAKRTFRYKDKRFARGPCKAATVKDAKLLKIVCQGKTQPIAYSLDEAAQGQVGVRFRSGGTEYCTLFGGTVTKDVQGKRFKAKKAPAPAECPAPPAPCP